MNRYPRGGPSRASATTLCQKCLQRGHYSYECKISVQDRPYTARPSRTQQLKNPDLLPAVTNTTIPEDLIKKQGTADEILKERNSKRQRLDESGRSVSRSPSVDSVSTISTNRSPSPAPAPRQRSRTRHRSRSREHRRRHQHHHRSRRHRHDREDRSDRGRHRHTSPRDELRAGARRDRYARDQSRSRSPPAPRRRSSYSASRSRSPARESQNNGSRRVRLSSSHARSPSPFTQRRLATQNAERPEGSPRPGREPPQAPSYQAAAPRERSLSPYSQRIAMTRAMNR